MLLSPAASGACRSVTASTSFHSLAHRKLSVAVLRYSSRPRTELSSVAVAAHSWSLASLPSTTATWMVASRWKSGSSLAKRAARALAKNAPRNENNGGGVSERKSAPDNDAPGGPTEASCSSGEESGSSPSPEGPASAGRVILEGVRLPFSPDSNEKLEDSAARPQQQPTAAPPMTPSQMPMMQSQKHLHEFAPRIVVVGVGGAGGNAVNNMIARSLSGVDFLALNTDAQHLSTTLTDNRLQLGSSLTSGLGCGANPDAGRLAAEECRDQITELLNDAHMVFITAGMGGGTGTGAAPVVAEICYDLGILTVGVVTKPFRFEGTHRMRLANEGIERLSSVVDTLIVIPNQNLFRLVTDQTSFVDSFGMADDVLLGGVRSITDLMTTPGLINLDFADVQSVMHGMGNAMLGTGLASDDDKGDNEDRAVAAAERALANPLLGENMDIGTAKGMLVNITGGKDMTLFEVDRAAHCITERVLDVDANIIFGSAYDGSLDGCIRVSVVATGIENGDVASQTQTQV